MKQTVKKLENRRLSFWQQIVSRSRLYNPDSYQGELLPAQPWKWPEGTYLQKKLQEARNGKI